MPFEADAHHVVDLSFVPIRSAPHGCDRRYLALFRHSGLESYFTNRRTGVPVFTTGPGTGNSERIPVRFQYPGQERTANADNYKSALQAQFAGNDDINGVMWILQ